MGYQYYHIMVEHTNKHPFEDCDVETYEKMMKSLSNIDLSKVIELQDNTNLSGEVACGGGACEIV